MSSEALVTILGMALATYATRGGGFWLAGHVSHISRVKKWLQYIPGAILVSMVVPESLSRGFPGILAVSGACLVMIRTRNLFLAMTVGVLMIVALRLVGLP